MQLRETRQAFRPRDPKSISAFSEFILPDKGTALGRQYLHRRHISLDQFQVVRLYFLECLLAVCHDDGIPAGREVQVAALGDAPIQLGGPLEADEPDDGAGEHLLQVLLPQALHGAVPQDDGHATRGLVFGPADDAHLTVQLRSTLQIHQTDSTAIGETKSAAPGRKLSVDGGTAARWLGLRRRSVSLPDLPLLAGREAGQRVPQALFLLAGLVAASLAAPASALLGAAGPGAAPCVEVLQQVFIAGVPVVLTSGVAALEAILAGIILVALLGEALVRQRVIGLLVRGVALGVVAVRVVPALRVPVHLGARRLGPAIRPFAAAVHVGARGPEACSVEKRKHTTREERDGGLGPP
mmetsp:Transcript_121320/g.387746  ORF Transcript_121320/g.387746 Transcript_121320/m.387746 type:complete len:354 (+) Transcript_121320:843-1904(+)